MWPAYSRMSGSSGKRRVKSWLKLNMLRKGLFKSCATAYARVSISSAAASYRSALRSASSFSARQTSRATWNSRLNPSPDSSLFVRPGSMLSGYQAEPFEQGVRVGIVSNEIAIQQGRIFAVPLFENLTAVVLSGRCIENSFPVKAREGIGIQHLRPFVRVVTGAICYRASEEMCETCDETIRSGKAY